MMEAEGGVTNYGSSATSAAAGRWKVERWQCAMTKSQSVKVKQRH